jgi:hypothetical protein
MLIATDIKNSDYDLLFSFFLFSSLLGYVGRKGLCVVVVVVVVVGGWLVVFLLLLQI